MKPVDLEKQQQHGMFDILPFKLKFYSNKGTPDLHLLCTQSFAYMTIKLVSYKSLTVGRHI